MSSYNMLYFSNTFTFYTVEMPDFIHILQVNTYYLCMKQCSLFVLKYCWPCCVAAFLNGSDRHYMPQSKTDSRGRHWAEWEETRVMDLLSRMRRFSLTLQPLTCFVALLIVCSFGVCEVSLLLWKASNRQKLPVLWGCLHVNWAEMGSEGKERKREREKGKQSPGLFGTTSGYHWKKHADRELWPWLPWGLSSQITDF